MATNLFLFKDKTGCSLTRASNTYEFILERNRLNVLFVENDLECQLTLFDTAEFTVERNHTNAPHVTRCLLSLPN